MVISEKPWYKTCALYLELKVLESLMKVLGCSGEACQSPSSLLCSDEFCPCNGQSNCTGGTELLAVVHLLGLVCILYVNIESPEYKNCDLEPDSILIRLKAKHGQSCHFSNQNSKNPLHSQCFQADDLNSSRFNTKHVLDFLEMLASGKFKRSLIEKREMGEFYLL